MDTTLTTANTRKERFDAFVASHRDAAVRTAWRLSGEDQAVAEEIAQDAFVKAWRALPRFREDAALSTWFYRILVREASNRRRWRGVRERWLLWLHASESSDSAWPDPGLQLRIRSAMDELSARQREVFTLVHLEQMDIVAVAEITGTSVPTAKTHLQRARTSLRAALADLKED